MNNVLSSPSMIAETIKNAFPFSVDSVRLQGPDNLRTDHFGLFRSDSLECIGNAVKEGYVPHSVDDVSSLAEAAFAAFGSEVSIHAQWKDGHYVTVRPGDKYMRSVFDARYPGSGAHQIRKDSDILRPRLVIRAGYDGRAFRVLFALERLVCRNLLAIPVEGKTVEASIRHTSSLRSKMDDLVKDFSRLLGKYDRIIETVNHAHSKTVNMADFIRTVYPLKDNATDAQIKRADKRVEQIMTRLYAERNSLGVTNDDPFEATAWEAFNAVQGQDQHDRTRHKDPSPFDRAIMSLDESNVKKAAELAFS